MLNASNRTQYFFVPLVVSPFDLWLLPMVEHGPHTGLTIRNAALCALMSFSASARMSFLMHSLGLPLSSVVVESNASPGIMFILSAMDEALGGEYASCTCESRCLMYSCKLMTMSSLLSQDICASTISILFCAFDTHLQYADWLHSSFTGGSVKIHLVTFFYSSVLSYGVHVL